MTNNPSCQDKEEEWTEDRPTLACEICWKLTTTLETNTTKKTVMPDGISVRLCKRHCEIMGLDFQ